MPKVSVIIPTYQRSALLKEAINSALNQDYTDYEIIVDLLRSNKTTEAIKYLIENNILNE